MSENNNIIVWLTNWYLKNCDGDWEHGDGIKISTLDNPGWAVSIYLAGTAMEDVHFSNIFIDRSENDWLRCKVEKSKFQGYCGTSNFIEMLNIFRSWVISTEENKN